jgi:hypothetical protein
MGASNKIQTEYETLPSSKASDNKEGLPKFSQTNLHQRIKIVVTYKEARHDRIKDNK